MQLTAALEEKVIFSSLCWPILTHLKKKFKEAEIKTIAILIYYTCSISFVFRLVMLEHIHRAKNIHKEGAQQELL